VIDPLFGYPRPDGRWGFRNHVLILPLHTAACTASARATALVPGTVTVAHDWTGDGHPADQDRVHRIFTGFATHPNVAGTVLLGLDESDEAIATAAATHGHPIEFLSLAGCGGSAATVEATATIARRMVAQSAGAKRQRAPLAALCLGLECGGSDALSGITANPALGVASDRVVAAGATTILAETSELIGAEHLLAARAVSPDVADALLATIARFEDAASALGLDLRNGQPVPGNIAGGLTTIEEKSLGAAKKGGNGPLHGVVDYAEPIRTPGLNVMDTPGNDIEQMVGMVAAGAQVVAFTTGRGTPTGSPIAPCLKIATNTDLYERLGGDLDLDAGTVLAGEPLDDVGERILDAVIDTLNGSPTAAERHGNREFALSRLHPRWPQEHA
jgi:altronate dehydratase large subunit